MVLRSYAIHCEGKSFLFGFVFVLSLLVCSIFERLLF